MLPRGLLILGIVLPVALLVGYLLATPTDLMSISFIALLLLGISIPLLMKWHYPALILSWNSTIIIFFIPGLPAIWTGLAVFTLIAAILERTLAGKSRMIWVPSVSASLIVLFIVAAITAALRGGVGGHAFGSDLWGARRYLGVFGALLGYFALVSQSIPESSAERLASGYFLSGVTAIVSDLAYTLGPGFYFIFALFSSEIANLQAASQETIQRSTGLAWAAWSVSFFILLRYGIAGVLDLRRFWRLPLLLLVISVGLFGGFRSTIVLLTLTFAVQFYFEGLVRTRFLPMAILTTVLVCALTLPFVDKLPLAVQRSLSFLPVDVDPIARRDAEGTVEWRLTMWKIVIREAQDYLLLGKGYGYSGTDYFLTQEAVRRGLYSAIEDTLISGNYHNGILTVLIPFGPWGLVTFGWFCYTAIRVLHSNYRHGNPRLNRINTFLLSFFVSRLIFYVVFYGQFDLDLMIFTGTVGLSVALNGGVAGRTVRSVTRTVPLPAAKEPDLALAPGTS